MSEVADMFKIRKCETGYVVFEDEKIHSFGKAWAFSSLGDLLIGLPDILEPADSVGSPAKSAT